MEWGVTLHSEGPFIGLPQYEVSLISSQEGSRVSVVATIEVRDSASGWGHMCRGILTGQRFRLQAEIPVGVHKVSILGARLTHLRGPVLKVDEGAKVLCHRPKDLSHLFQLIETCSGLGALGVGASHAGWKTVVHNDCMEPFCEHLRVNSKVPTVHGDICKLATVAQIHEAARYAASIAFGFSCQPFSRAGDKKEGMDDRAKTLPFGLYAAHLLQLDLVITECVPEASTSPYVLKCLQQYMQMTNSDRSETLMDLANVWPSRRRRWWSILLKSYMGRVSIPPFPKLSIEPTIACLFPCLLTMTQQELAELRLTPEERIMFERYGKGLGGHMINFAEPLATALHSWGNQCIACACGCRGPLSTQRLQTQGLFGVLAHVPGQSPDQNVRHLSGREMALLTGFPKVSGWTDQQRLLTAGVGQLASPLQAVWVFAAVFNHLIDHGFCPGDSIPPKQLLACVAMDLFKLRDEWFGNHKTVAMDMFQEHFETLLEPTVVQNSAGSFQDLTMSQDAELADAIDSIDVVAQEAHKHSSPPTIELSTNAVSKEPLQIGHTTQVDQSVDSPSRADTTDIALPKRSSLPSEPAQQSDNEPKQVEPKTPDVSPSFTNSNGSPISTPMWAASGAISAFATNPIKVGQSVPAQRIQDMPKVAPLTFKQLSASPNDLTCTGIMIYDADNHTISHQKCTPHATYDQWTQANLALLKHVGHCRDLFGQEIQPDMELVVLKWIIISQAPPVGHHQLADSMRALSSLPRIESSLMQGPAVASDEMMFYLTAIAAVGLAQAKPPFIIDGMTDLQIDAKIWIEGLDHVNQHNMHQLAQLADQWIQVHPVTEATVTAIWTNYHWVPVWIVPNASELIVHTTFEGMRIWEMLFPWWSSIVNVHDELPQRFSLDCGFRTFAWLVGQCTQTPLQSLTEPEAWGWRHLFWQTLVTIPKLSHQFVLGGQSELEVAIQAILREHGVFPSRLPERTALILRSLPTQSLGAVFHASRPWQAPKQLASSHKPPIRLVLEDELQSTIKSRTADKRSVQAKPKGQTSAQVHHHVGPEDILIPHGIFCLKTGEPVAQIPSTVRPKHSWNCGIYRERGSAVSPSCT